MYSFTEEEKKIINTSKVFVIKKGNKTKRVRATTFLAIDGYCKDNGFVSWVLAGMA